jgi:RNA polymerase sigma-70 factor (ECF subfamily)
MNAMNRPGAALEILAAGPARPAAPVADDLVQPEEVVARCREGEMGAWRELFSDHGPYLRRLLSRIGVEAADVDDALQDVFVVAHRKIGGFDGRSRVRTWLTGIALRVASQNRRRAMVRRLGRALVGAPVPAAVPTPEDLAEISRGRPVLHEILAGIGERKRAVFVLYEIEGLEGDEIAKLLDCSINTVWSRLRHARAEFRRAIARRRARERRA